MISFFVTYRKIQWKSQACRKGYGFRFEEAGKFLCTMNFVIIALSIAADIIIVVGVISDDVEDSTLVY